MPSEINVRELMDAPEGTEQVGDEFHDPSNWTACPDPLCGVDVRVDMDNCWKCGSPVDHGTQEAE